MIKIEEWSDIDLTVSKRLFEKDLEDLEWEAELINENLQRVYLELDKRGLNSE